MPERHCTAMCSFADELLKLAVDWHRVVGNAAALGGVGAGVGAVVGGVRGGLDRYHDARLQGASLGQSAWSGAGGMLGGVGSGAVRGAVIGAGLGSIAPGAVHSRLAANTGAIGTLARTGQRQLHGFTGWLPTKNVPSSLESIRGGAYAARERLAGAKAQLERAWAGDSARPLKQAIQEVERGRAGLAAMETAQNRGLTSLPGYLRALRHDPNRLGTIRAGFATQWHGMGPTGKALMVGLPAVSIAQTLKGSPTSESGRPPGVGERVGGAVGDVVGGVVTAPLSILPGAVTGAVVGSAGRRVGRLIDRARGRQAPAQELAVRPENMQGQYVPGERQMSPAAAGQSPEIGT